MKPQQRKQLPPRLFNLVLIEADADDSIVVFCGNEVRPVYTPLFDKHDKLVAIFYSTMKDMIFSRRAEMDVSPPSWPRDRLFLDRTKLARYMQGHDIVAELVALNAMSNELIDLYRDARPIWERASWQVDWSLSNTDAWVKSVETRVGELKKNTAKAVGVDGKDNMAFLGLVLAAVASLEEGSDNELMRQLSQFDALIDLEASCWLNQPINPAYAFTVGFASALVDYPHKTHLNAKDNLIVHVRVPEFMPFLGRNGSPFHEGWTFIGLKAFRVVARKLFHSGWKKWAVLFFRRLKGFGEADVALLEFMQRIRIKRNTVFGMTGPSIASPELLFPVISPLAPPCLQKLFSDSRNLKHYARWQLAELAVDMQWSKTALLNLVKSDYRHEISASMDSYKRKGPLKARCRILMKSTDLCPFSKQTFNNCCADVKDIEDMTPATSFHFRLLAEKNI